MAIIHCILLAIFSLISFFYLLSIGYYAGRMRELSIRQKNCDDIKKQIPNKKWKKWQRRNINGRFYQLLVLFGIVHSPSYEYWYR